MYLIRKFNDLEAPYNNTNLHSGLYSVILSCLTLNSYDNRFVWVIYGGDKLENDLPIGYFHKNYYYTNRTKYNTLDLEGNYTIYKLDEYFNPTECVISENKTYTYAECCRFIMDEYITPEKDNEMYAIMYSYSYKDDLVIYTLFKDNYFYYRQDVKNIMKYVIE